MNVAGNPEAGNKYGKANLIPATVRTPEERRMMGRTGGRSKSLAKSEGAKMRCIKENLARGVANPKDIEWILQKLTDRPSMAADLIKTIELLKREGAIHPSQRVALANVEVNALKAIHGEKIKTENVNINVNTTVEEWERRVADLIDEEEKRG